MLSLRDLSRLGSGSLVSRLQKLCSFIIAPRCVLTRISSKFLLLAQQGMHVRRNAASLASTTPPDQPIVDGRIAWTGMSRKAMIRRCSPIRAATVPSRFESLNQSEIYSAHRRAEYGKALPAKAAAQRGNFGSVLFDQRQHICCPAPFKSCELSLPLLTNGIQMHRSPGEKLPWNSTLGQRKAAVLFLLTIVP